MGECLSSLTSDKPTSDEFDAQHIDALENRVGQGEGCPKNPVLWKSAPEEDVAARPRSASTSPFSEQLDPWDAAVIDNPEQVRHHRNGHLSLSPVLQFLAGAQWAGPAGVPRAIVTTLSATTKAHSCFIQTLSRLITWTACAFAGCKPDVAMREGWAT